ncbi:MAG: ATP-binding protein [Flammeovirgaceae bacterium]|nr:ATP-binding protein [Flammeovirgaceae bacterium]
MKMIPRLIQTEAIETAHQFRSVCIIGPRQSGKTTLSRLVFGNKPYVNLENPTVETELRANTEDFLKRLTKGAILDEVQRVPEVFRFLQEILDKTTQRGKFILTGSNNFLLQERIAQSLAGRIGYLELLPLSYAELVNAKMAYNNIHQHIITGGYPEIWQQKLNPAKWMSSYVLTYVQRDVRLLRNISNLGAFSRFVYLCANYAGQILNKDALAKSSGVDSKTINSWLSVMESSYLIYLLQPYYNNLNKRIVKSPKLYFYDTGLLCYLLGITSVKSLTINPKYGALFENWMISEIRKNRCNQGISGGMYYFRDSMGNELDLILEKQDETYAIEIKSGKKFNREMLAGISYWLKYNKNGSGILIHGADQGFQANDPVSILGWKEVGEI